MTEIYHDWRPCDPVSECGHSWQEFFKWIFAFSAIINLLSGVLYVSSGNYHEKFIDTALTGNPLRGAQLSSLDETFEHVAH
jgi:hypothetical protein